MKKLFFIIGLMIIACSSFAQSWTQGQYTEFKGVIANEVLRIPRRDTIALGGSKDSIGQIIYRPANATVYVKTPTGWQKVSIQKSTDSVYLYREDKYYVVGRGQYGDPTSESEHLIDTTLNGWNYEVFRRGWGYYQKENEIEILSTGGFQLLIEGDLLYEGDFISIRFYPKKVPTAESN